MTGERPARSAAELTARRQLGRVLLALAVLDVGVIVFVVGIAEVRNLLSLTGAAFLLLVLGGVGTILVTRVLLAVRLRRRQGDLS